MYANKFASLVLVRKIKLDELRGQKVEPVMSHTFTFKFCPVWRVLFYLLFDILIKIPKLSIHLLDAFLPLQFKLPFISYLSSTSSN